MVFINDSLNVVLLGDWNQLYSQPDWIAENVFEKEEMEIGLSGQGTDFTVRYKADGVIIAPGLSSMIFSVTDTGESELKSLCEYLNNFLEKASTPQFAAYGLNAEFVEENVSAFADVIDSMADAEALVNNGCVIVSTQISRTLRRNNKLINMSSNLENNNLQIRFNEHHIAEESRPNFTLELVKSFIKECREILSGLGYEMEGEE
ncbi:MAG: hypothetical protein MR440_00785 [Firmicutes bacterium]|jgi:flagellar hook-basal body complex protein FliE|nr:hypothetical protein [Bacillota bacterium]CDA89618.1 uncharacterized protein BN553_00967 [Firmicutes bacterium CAG:238]